MNLKFNSLHTVNYRVEYENYISSLLLLLYYKMTEQCLTPEHPTVQ